MNTTKKFLRITREVFSIYWAISPVLLLTILATNILLTVQPLINAYVFSYVLDKIISFVGQGQVSALQVLPIVAILGAVNLVSGLVANINDYGNSLLSSQDIYKLRLKQIDFMSELGIAQMEDPELTNKVTRFNEVYAQISQHLSILISLVSLVVSVVISGAVLFHIQSGMVLVFVTLFVLKYFNNTRFRNKIWYLTRDNTEERRNAWTSASWLSEPMFLKEILISGGSLLLRKKFLGFVEWFYKEYAKVRTRWAFYETFHTMLDVTLFSFGVYLVVEKGLAGAISIGLITFYVRTLISFADQMDTLSYRLGRSIESSIRIQDALELFELYKPEVDGTDILHTTDTPPAIEVTDVTFSYPESKYPVLKGFNLTIKPGEKIAIVGENGAGKTTLVKVLARIYKPQTGVVTIDGKNVNDIQIKSWYKKLGVLFQDFNTYGNLTVSENVHIGRSDTERANTEKVILALKEANAYDFVQKYPKQLDQKLSERYKGGIRPSGGQWQKLAIARFFYRNAPVLILDEPTAAIDAISEAQIFDNIYKFMKGKTVIIISHRFSTVRNADRIIVLDKGKIIEDGSHEELLSKNGKYAKSFHLQAEGYK